MMYTYSTQQSSGSLLVAQHLFTSFQFCMYNRSTASCPKEDAPMEIRRLDHAALLVKDVERSRRFYGQVLGMEEVSRPSNFKFPGAWFRKGRAEIHLIGEAEPDRVSQVQPGYRREEQSRGYAAHIAFEV